MKEKIKDGFIGGLILLTPLIVTYIVIKTVLDWTSMLFQPVSSFFQLGMYFGNMPFLTNLFLLGVGAGIVTFVGLLASTRRGNLFLGEFGKLVKLVPLVRGLYFSLRNFSTSVVDNRGHYDRSVLVEYPREGVYRLGFVTSESNEKIQDVDERNLINVLILNTPNPTGGLLAIIPEENIHEVDMSVRESMKFLMTSGISGMEEEISEIEEEKGKE